MRSRRAFAEASRERTIDIAEEKFPAAFASDVWREPGLAPGDRVDAYLGEYGARIERANGRGHAIMESNVPLVARDESGELRPVELALEDRGDHLASANPIVPLKLWKDPRAGVLFERTGLRFALEDAPSADASKGRSIRDRLHHGNVKRDTSLFVVPKPYGAEAFFVLLSEDSPERLALDFDLPDGARLEMAGDGSGSAAVMARDGKALALIPPAATIDADGHRVATEMEVSGNKLVLRVDHHGQDVRFPLLTDPAIVEVTSGNGFNGTAWQPGAKQTSSGWFAGWLGAWDGVSYAGSTGLNIWSAPNAFYPFGNYAEWYLRPYRHPVIIPAVVFTASHWPHRTMAQYGIWHIADANNNGHWVQDGTSNNPYLDDRQFTHAVWPICVQWAACRMDKGETDAHATMAMVMWHPPDWRSGSASAQLERVDVFYGDKTVPSVGGVNAFNTRSWAETDSVTVSGTAEDQGIGLAKVGLSAPGRPSYSGPAKTPSCTGGSAGQCPTQLSTDPELIARTTDAGLSGVEGQIPIDVFAQDKIWDSTTYPDHQSSKNVGSFRIDLSPPGTYSADDGKWLKGGNHQLPATVSDSFSGVRESQLWVASASDRFERTTASGWGAADQVAEPGPARVAYWRLNEPGGTEAQDSVGGHHGTYTGGYTLNEAGATPDGDRAVKLNGTSGYVNVGNPDPLKLSTGTVEAWVKASSPGSGYRGIVAKEWAYGLFLKDGVVMAFDWSTFADRSTGFNIADGSWHHVAMTFQSGVSGGTVIYVDGYPRLVTTITASNQDTGLQIGASGGGGQLGATIDDVAVHDRALSAAEVAQHYRGRGWTVDGGPASDFSVGPDGGRVDFPAGGGHRSATLWGAQIKDVDVGARIKFGRPTTGSGVESFAYLTLRRQPNWSNYRVGLARGEDGRIRVIGRNGSDAAMFPDQYTSLPVGTDTAYLRVLASSGSSTSSTEIKVKYWRVGTDEPAAWNIVATDTGAGSGPHTAGAVGIHVNGGSTTAQQFYYDDIKVLDRDATQVKDGTKQDGSVCDATSGCPTSLTHTYALNTAGFAEGPIEVVAEAADAVNDVSGSTADWHRRWSNWQRKLDRTPPTFSLSDVGYDLRADQGRWLRARKYTVGIEPTDSGSGVARMGLEVDGTEVASAAPDCAEDTCSKSYDLTYDAAKLTDGQHTVRTTVTDKAGNVGEESWSVKVDKTAPTLTVWGPLRNAEGQQLNQASYALEASGSDAGSGVRDIVVVVDDQRQQSRRVDCPNGGCALASSWSYQTANYLPRPHEIHVVAADTAGNTRYTSWKVAPNSSPVQGCTTADPPATGPSGGHVVAASAAASTLDSADGAALAATQETTITTETATTPSKTVDPTVEPAGTTALEVEKGLVAGSIGTNTRDGYSIGSGESSVCLKPAAVSPTATQGSVQGDAVLYANTAPSTDTVVRPTAVGADTVTQIRDSSAPESKSWVVQLEEGEELRKLTSGQVVIVRVGVDRSTEEETSATSPYNHAEGWEIGDQTGTISEDGLAQTQAVANSTQTPDAKQQITQGTANVALAQQEVTDGTVVGALSVPTAHDAAGTPIPSSVEVAGETITQKVEHHDATYAYPVVAKEAFAEEAPGFKAIGGAMPDMQWSVLVYKQGERDAGGDCAFEDNGGEIAAGQGFALSGIALNSFDCTWMIQWGGPSQTDLDTEQRSAEADAESLPTDDGLPLTAARRYPRGHAWMKSYWTDPVGVVVAKIRNDVAYHYGGGCIHSPAREFARTGVFKVSNWSKKEHDHNHDRHCKQIWSSSYTLFRNPGYPTGFPACRTPGPLEIPSHNDVHLHVKRNNIHVTPDNNGYWHPWKMKRTGNKCRLLLSPHKVGYIPQGGRVHP